MNYYSRVTEASIVTMNSVDGYAGKFYCDSKILAVKFRRSGCRRGAIAFAATVVILSVQPSQTIGCHARVELYLAEQRLNGDGNNMDNLNNYNNHNNNGWNQANDSMELSANIERKSKQTTKYLLHCKKNSSRYK